MMIRATLIALNQANQTDNYSVLYALGTPQLQKDADVKKLAQAFAGFRQRNIDMSPVVMFAPVFARPPMIDPHGLLRVLGAFPTQPLQIRFSLAYRLVDGRWRVEGLNVDAVPAPQSHGAIPDPGFSGGPAARATLKKTAARPQAPAAGAPAAPAKQVASGGVELDHRTDPPTTNKY